MKLSKQILILDFINYNLYYQNDLIFTMSNPKIITIDNLSLQEFDSEAELIPLLTLED